MAAITAVFTVARAARMLGVSGKIIEELAEPMDSKMAICGFTGSDALKTESVATLQLIRLMDRRRTLWI